MAINISIVQISHVSSHFWTKTLVLLLPSTDSLECLLSRLLLFPRLILFPRKRLRNILVLYVQDCLTFFYYRGDKKLPIYSYTSPNLKRIFQICLKKDILVDRMAEIKPASISSTSTFVVDQKFAKVKHPFDVEADETLGAYEKKERQTRFYEVKVNDEGELLISSEVSVNIGSKGIVVGGTYNTRDGRNWVKQVANKKHLYAVVRKELCTRKPCKKLTPRSQDTSFSSCQ